MSKPYFVCLLCLIACGDSDATPDANDPTNIPFGTTAIVVVVNPVVNDANAKTVPTPGLARSGITLATDDNVTTTTGADGIAVLAPVTAGARTITVSGAATGSFTVTVAPGTLREVALATDANRAEIMLDVDYTADQVMEVNPSMTNAEVNDILKPSDRVVFFEGGVYQGDLDFSGSRVTLFGEGVLGGTVVLEGNVVVSGSDSRIRGTHIMGNLMMSASKVGLSFSRVDGTSSSVGSDGMLLANALCGSESITGSGTIALGNAGAAPVTACP